MQFSITATMTRTTPDRDTITSQIPSFVLPNEYDQDSAVRAAHAILVGGWHNIGMVGGTLIDIDTHDIYDIDAQPV